MIPSQAARKRWARMALQWYRAGYAPADATADDPEALVRSAVTKCANEHGGQFEHLEFGFAVSTVLVTETDDRERNHPRDCAAQLIAYTDGYGYGQYRLIKDGFAGVPQQLAETALHWLGRASWELSLNLVAPSTIRDQCIDMLWFGETTQKEFEIARDGFGDEPLDDEGDATLSPALYDASMPGWVHTPSARLKTNRLRQYAKAGDHQKLAICVLDLAKVLDAESNWPKLDDEMRSVPSPAALRWSPQDSVARAIDDIDNWLSQDEYATDVLSLQDIPASDAEFNAWLEGFIRWLNALRLTDQLIGLISKASDA